LKGPSLPLSIAATALLMAAAIASAAQAPQAAPPAGGTPHSFPAPTNLKVLPKTMTGEKLHELMHQWAGSLGTHCDHCHTTDPNHLDQNGHPRFNFADDSKPEKLTARQMYRMTQDINKNYVSKIPNADEPVSCATCHRGHAKPEHFEIPDPEHGSHPPPGSASPAAPKP
jgi:hypothetical protein